MRIGLGQMELKLGDIDFNIKQTQEILDAARDDKVDIVFLPELANSGYTFASKEEAMNWSEEIPEGPYSKSLIDWSKNGGLVVAGINERTKEGLYNSAAIIGDGRHLATYRKYNLFDPEKRWFLQGPSDQLVFEYKNITCGVIICVEWRYPERTRKASELGAQLILHPVNSGARHYDTMCDLASENGVYIASANRVGQEHDFKFTGGSAIFSPEGEIILEMDSRSHMLGWADITI